jgi:uncharacterized SAM-binding protein YcdF (DUF218 family)
MGRKQAECLSAWKLGIKITQQRADDKVDQRVTGRNAGFPAFLPVCTRWRLWWGTALLLSVLLVGFAGDSILRGVASFLIVEDRLESAAAIVSLGGKLPFREIEAAKLYREGWASRLIVVPEAPSAESEALQALGIQKTQEWKLSREVLMQQGVPASAIFVAEQQGLGTLEELQAAYAAIPAKDAPVILVTSKYHTRRTRLIWKYVTQGRSRAIVRAATREPFDPALWWHTRRHALSVVREYLGLLNYYAGFPIS